MKNYLLLLLISIIVFSCKKEGVNKEVMMENFVKSMKTQPSKVEGSTVVLTKTEKTGNNEIIIEKGRLIQAQPCLFYPCQL